MSRPLLPPSSSFHPTAPQHAFENLRPVMFLVPGPVDQRDGSFAGLLAEQANRLGMRLQLGAIALLKSFPPRRVVAEPLAQLRTGRDFLEPQIDRRLLLGHAPRPQAVHQHAKTVP